MGRKADRFTKLVDRYEGSVRAQGRMAAINSSSQRVAEIETKAYEADLTFKEAKTKRKASKAKMEEAMAKLEETSANNIMANLEKLAAKAAETAATNVVTGKS